MHVIHLIIFRDFPPPDGFELALCANGSPCCVPRQASWICTQNAVRTFIYNCQRSLHISRPGWRQKKGVENTKKPLKKITEMPIHMGLILSHDLCVCRNMVGNLWWNFYFTNYRPGRFARDKDHRWSRQICMWCCDPTLSLKLHSAEMCKVVRVPVTGAIHPITTHCTVAVF